MTTAAKKLAIESMVISFPKEDLKRLKGIAKAMGWTLEKKEELPEGYGRMEELSDEDCWNYLVHTQPEGMELLSEEENEEFLDWLGVKR